MCKASICIATYNKPQALANTLDSIFVQEYDYEVIVVDDGSPESETEQICKEYPLQYMRVDRPPRYRNPAAARNIAYKRAQGEIIIAQSDDVIHKTEDCVAKLCSRLQQGTFVIATVININDMCIPVADVLYNGRHKISEYTGIKRKRPLFFLGALYRKDLYSVGGNDEEFCFPGREDVWFSLCLTNGLKLSPIYTADVIGYHQNHSRRIPGKELREMHHLFNLKYRAAMAGRIPWCSFGGPWPFSSTSNFYIQSPHDNTDTYTTSSS